MKSPMSKDEILKQLKTILEYDYRTDAKEANVTQIYRALSTIVVNYMKEKINEVDKNNITKTEGVFEENLEGTKGLENSDSISDSKCDIKL